MVLLLTRNADDIPFDLKHHQHTVYSGKIELLRTELATKLRWALAESKRLSQPLAVPRLELSWGARRALEDGVELQRATFGGVIESRSFRWPFALRNVSSARSSEITHVYLLTTKEAPLVPTASRSFASTTNVNGVWDLSNVASLKSASPEPANPIFRALEQDKDGLEEQYRLRMSLPGLPPGAVEEIGLDLLLRDPVMKATTLVCLRLHSPQHLHEFRFNLYVDLNEKASKATEEAKGAHGTSTNGDDTGRADDA